ncbi:hypothetical protein GHL01_00310 [Sinorhizobium meliloti]|uniref:Pam3-gp28 family putative phage holin n=1 Tax=Rhizobium meliloti TaxID=382 RepID=UPI00129662AC|nr:hypothetical protein [Sinorhizobium meliloti]MQV12187.1 hypothetical protein [Sinorhizobium meliloti]
MNPAVLGFVRHAITLFAGMFLANTSLSPDDIETLASAAVVIINLGWFAYDRHRAGDLRPRKGRRP